MDREHLMRGWSLTALVGNSDEVRDARRDAGQGWTRLLADRQSLQDNLPRA
jgi:hypothetical protein